MFETRSIDMALLCLHSLQSWSTDGGGSFATAESRGNTTRPGVVQVWFAARLYSDVDFENGVMVRVCAPW